MKRIVFRAPGFTVYRKASRAAAGSEIDAEDAAKGRLSCEFVVRGLERDGCYYYLVGRLGSGSWISGYVHESDVDRLEDWKVPPQQQQERQNET